MMDKKEKGLKRKTNISGFPKGLQKTAYIFCVVMLIPAVYGILKYLITNAYSVLLAFSEGVPFKDKWSLISFKIFWTEFTQDNGALKISFINSLRYYGVALVKSFLSYVVAYFLYKKIPGNKAFRFLFFLPSVISPIISVSIFKEMIREMGPVWTFIKDNFGIVYKEPLAYPETATNAIILYQYLTGFGTTFLIYIGTMNRIPGELLESAALDGCNVWREFWSVLFPLTWGTFSTFLLMTATTVFTASGPILYFTNGAAKTSTLGFWLFNQVRGGNYNYPSAVGIVLTLATVPIVLLVRFIMKKLDAEVSY